MHGGRLSYQSLGDLTFNLRHWLSSLPTMLYCKKGGGSFFRLGAPRILRREKELCYRSKIWHKIHRKGHSSTKHRAIYLLSWPGTACASSETHSAFTVFSLSNGLPWVGFYEVLCAKLLYATEDVDIAKF
ncbi:hypothetical protein EI94DRAFT_1830584 [Lactarius quietus]|nr:hypothetical protein EI94DRAFT_1830584 [Lactarius quietus]